ncbi:glycosyltransferase [Aequorivita sublithincola DSM 14238]|uniref:Glycosyltransferase n=1 Tax=Aequorivita sublithincola (strain DSM 14238 / LMG 21431 / ACAM 643 / 9-3) TaxID=746697 RepID=I3YUN2_AEQSU|nr:glycosyltransferase [Aequorivita sublithincola]AFL80700.1 glycosyltransferase [Aequorivita sublithincola DSM 14238]
MNKKLAIYGAYPPPLGGISVHIKRIEPYLESENIDYTIFNFGSYKKENVIPTHKSVFWYLKILFIKKYKLFHFHEMVVSIDYIFYFLFSYFNKTKFIITIHAGELSRLNLFCLTKTKNIKVISVSENINKLLLLKDIDSILLPAYVPPLNVSTKELKKDQRIYFLFSVWKVTKELSEKIYNIPLALHFLKMNTHKYKMLFLIGNKKISDLDYLNKIIETYGVMDSVEIIYEENLVEYIRNCSFLLKTNLVDGYGIALQEAMDLGIPAIATDVCVRPKGTVLFKDNNLTDMTEKISQTLSQPVENILKNKEDLQYHYDLIKIYKQMLNN